MSKPGQLNPKQSRFVQEFLIDLNATQACIRAGYKEKNSGVVGPRLLQIPHVAEAIAKGKAEQLERADLSASRVLEELRRLSFSDLSQMVDEHGRLKQLHLMPVAVRSAIASVKLTKKNLTTGDGIVDDVIEVKLWDKVRALEMLAKHFKLLTEVLQVQDAAGGIATLQRGRDRVAAMKAKPTP